MPRFARLDAPDVLHHVMGRGIEKRKIFLDEEDRFDFLSRLEGIVKEKGMDVYAWALLANHVHLLCKTKGRSLSVNMRKLLTGYAMNFNRRHGRHGHLFQNRYKLIVCQEETYLTELVRYIHLNLLRSGVVKDLRGLRKSPGSGHSVIMGEVKRPWQDTGYVLANFGKGSRGRRNYLKFVEDGVAMGRRSEMVGGGLVRSLGGWSAVLALRERGDRQASDERILGDGDFVEAVLEEVEEKGKENWRGKEIRMELSTLAGKVCQAHGVSLGELRSGSRREDVIEARARFSEVAVKGLGYSGAEVARYLGVTSSCVTRVVSKGGMEEDWQAQYGIL